MPAAPDRLTIGPLARLSGLTTRALRHYQLRTAHSLLGLPAGGSRIEDVMPLRPTSVALDPQAQRKAAADLFNYTWTLLEKPDRSERESDLMIHAAHASRFFWGEIGEPVNHARGEWQIARVYAVLDRPEPALFHARRCLQIAEKHRLGDVDLAFAYEALARAHAVAGEREAAVRYERQGREAAQRIEDADDRDLVLGDLDGLP
jgi:hypothetical protein